MKRGGVAYCCIWKGGVLHIEMGALHIVLHIMHIVHIMHITAYHAYLAYYAYNAYPAYYAYNYILCIL